MVKCPMLIILKCGRILLSQSETAISVSALFLLLLSISCGSSKAIAQLNGGLCVYNAYPKAVLRYVSSERYTDPYSDSADVEYLVKFLIVMDSSNTLEASRRFSGSCMNEFVSKEFLEASVNKEVQGSCAPEIIHLLDSNSACAHEFGG